MLASGTSCSQVLCSESAENSLILKNNPGLGLWYTRIASLCFVYRLKNLRHQNVKRCIRWHKDGCDRSGQYWS